MRTYMPKIVYDEAGLIYGEMLVELKRCYKCNQYMVNKPSRKIANTFPNYFKLDFDTQVLNAGWHINSRVKVDDEYICAECTDSGKADFECYICKERHPVNLIEQSFGDPQEFLCKNCYKTVPAATWDYVVDELEKRHKYDFD